MGLDEGEKLEFEQLTIEHVMEWVGHATEDMECSYMEIVADGPQKPQYAVTHYFTGQLWRQRMSAIEVFAEAQQLPDSAIFFVEVLSLATNEDYDDVWKAVKSEVEGTFALH